MNIISSVNFKLVFVILPEIASCLLAVEAFILFRISDAKIIRLKNLSESEPFQLGFAPYDPWIGHREIRTADVPRSQTYNKKGPRILCEGRAQDIDTTTIVSNLRSDKFQKAKHGLRQFIENYESRVFIFHIQKIVGYKSASYKMICY